MRKLFLVLSTTYVLSSAQLQAGVKYAFMFSSLNHLRSAPRIVDFSHRASRSAWDLTQTSALGSTSTCIGAALETPNWLHEFFYASSNVLLCAAAGAMTVTAITLSEETDLIEEFPYLSKEEAKDLGITEEELTSYLKELDLLRSVYQLAEDRGFTSYDDVVEWMVKEGLLSELTLRAIGKMVASTVDWNF